MDFVSRIIADAESVKKAADSTRTLNTRLNDLAKNANTVSTSMRNLGAIVGGFGVVSIKEVMDVTVKYNKTLYDMSRQSKVTGQDFSKLVGAIDTLNKTTSLSKKEATEFTQTMMTGTRAIKLSASAITDLGRALTSEFGPSLDNINKAMGDLLAIQQKDIYVLDKLRKGMDPKNAVAYISAMEQLNGISEQQAESFLRAASAMGKQGAVLTEEEKKLRRAADAQQKFQKALEDVKVNWAEKLADLLPKIDETLSSIVGVLKSIPKGALEMMVKLAIGGGIVAGVGKVASAAGGLAGGAGGGPGKHGILSGLMGGSVLKNDGSASTKPLYVKSVDPATGLPGSPEDAAGGIGSKIKGLLNNPMLVGGAAMAGGAYLNSLSESAMTKDADGNMQHTEKSKALGLAGGIAQGAGAGMMVAGPIGAFVGGLIGAIDPLMEFAGATENAAESSKRAMDMYGETIDATISTWDKIKGAASNFELGDLDPRRFIGNGLKAIGNAAGGNYKYDTGHDPNNPQNSNKLNDTVRNNIINDRTFARQVQSTYGEDKTFSQLGKDQRDQIESQARNKKQTADRYGIQGGNVEKIVEKAFAEELGRQAAKALGKSGEEQEKLAVQFAKGELGAGSDVAKMATNKDVAATAQANVRGQYSTFDSKDLNKGLESQKSLTDNVYRMRNEYNAANASLEFMKQQLDTINAANEKLIDNALKYENNTGKASEMYKEILSNYDKEYALTQKLLTLKQQINGTSDQAAQAAKEIEAELKKQGFAGDELMAKTKEMLQIGASEKDIRAKLADIDSKRVKTNSDLANIYREQQSLLDAQLGQMESELQLSQSMYLGLGPTIEAQQKILNTIEKKLELVDKEIAAAEALIQQHPTNLKYQEDLAKKQQQKNQLVNKELELTKNLREGYLDAMGAFTNVEGSFAKIITRREQGMGEIIRNFGAKGGFKTGAGGAGSDNPMMKWGAGGKLDFAGPDAMNENAETYGGFGGPVIRNRLNVAAASKAAGTESYFGAAATGAGGAVGSEAEIKRLAMGGSVAAAAPAGAAPAGTAPSAALANAASQDPVVAAVLTLDKNMPDHVAEGMKRAYGPMMDVGAFKTGAGKTTATGVAGAATTETAGVKAQAAAVVAEMAKSANAGGGTGKGGPSVIGTGTNFADLARGKTTGASMDDYNKAIENLDSQIAGFKKSIDAGVDVENNKARLDMATDKKGQITVARDMTQKENENQAMLDNFNKYLSENRPGGRNQTPLSNTNADVQVKMAALAKNAVKEAEKAAPAGVGAGKRSDNFGGDRYEARWMDDGKTVEFVLLTKAITDQTAASKELNKTTDEVGKKWSDTITVFENPESEDDQSKYATGGFVPGTGNKDNVPSLLMPGEYVVNKETTRKYGWLLNQLNQNKFADGGYVGGLMGASPSAATAMAAGGGSSFSPSIMISAKGDSINKVTRMVTSQLSNQLNKMMTPSGSSGRFFDATQ